MPAFVAINRRWGFGSDDLVISSSLLILVHAPMLVLNVAQIILSLSTETRNEECDSVLINFMLFQVSFIVLCLLVDGTTFYVASKGTILTPLDRKATVPLFLARCVILVPQILTSFFVVARMWNDNDMYKVCRQHGSSLLIWNGIFNFCVGLSGAICLLFTFDHYGRHPVKRRKLNNSDEDLHYTKINTDAWESRLSRISFLCGGNQSREKFKDNVPQIAKIMSKFFVDRDYVPSDLLAGLILVEAKQKETLRKIKAEPSKHQNNRVIGETVISFDTQIYDPSNTETRTAFNELKRQMVYAHAAYGFGAIYLEFGFLQLLWIWLKNLRNRSNVIQKFNLHKVTIYGDTAGYDRTTYLARFLSEKYGLSPGNVELIHVDWRNTVSKQPYFVAYDKDKNNLVISIRGTMSKYDVLTDVKGDATRIGEGVAGLAHQGIRDCAAIMLDELDKLELFDKYAQVDKIVVTGHSLGAGVAAILALMLNVRFTNRVACYAFSPPGGLLCPEANDHADQVITSLFVGNDIIPRLGLTQLENLESAMIECFKRTDYHKWHIIISSIMNKFRCIPDDHAFLCEDRNHTSEPLNSKTHGKSVRRDHHRFTCLHPPGKIIQLLPEKDSVTAIRTKSDELQHIVLSNHMVSHHMPHFVYKTISRLTNE